ncbi:hypothetical protein TSUD_294630 [Trifolium subterraneum]|uniref:Ubiquitin-like protease family profile domain-containing protein n=1 Tax=Trifolium subterraneum TaxID=3900 RepID=A0A2Z6N9U1_TRISU|nr:hypothetical protein TSUD_294630 [Trifolium subterraneum]
MAMKTTWSQYRAVNKTVWSLPPTFAVDVIQGTNIEVLATKYGADWMIPYTTLKYIYVPIKDKSEHWYLMVISIKDHMSAYTTRDVKGTAQKLVC